MLVFAGDIEPGAALVAGIPQIADAVALTHIVVDAVTVGIDGVACRRGGERPVRRGRATVYFFLIERAETGFDAAGRRLAGAGLGDDVDDAAHRAVAVQYRASVAARDFDALDAVA